MTLNKNNYVFNKPFVQGILPMNYLQKMEHGKVGQESDDDGVTLMNS